MALFLAAAVMLSSLTPRLADDPYDNAAVESEPTAEAVEEAPTDPRAYLYARYPRYARRLDCVIGHESRWNPSAYNPRSGASGLAQFLYGTWMSTPQGKAGASRTNPIASIDGAVFLIEQTPQSWRHWAVISLC